MPEGRPELLHLKANQFLREPARNTVNESKTRVELHEVILHLPDGLSRHVFLIRTGEQHVVRPRGFLRLPLLSKFRFSLSLKIQARLRATLRGETIDYGRTCATAATLLISFSFLTRS